MINMKHIIYQTKNYALALIMALSLCSCEAWLSEVPSSQVSAEEQFSNVEGFQQALVGCYISLADNSLYGNNLTTMLPDIMAQQYDNRNTGSNENGYAFHTFAFQHQTAQAILEDVWQSAYNVIANVNLALEYIEKNKSIFNEIDYSVIKGEFLAIRAMVHFDIMRLFGLQNLNSESISQLTIPFQKKASKQFTPQLSYKETIDLLVDDLEEAIELLKKDPIVYKDETFDIINIDGFYNYRQMRLNQIATKAILARVYMWEGSNESLTSAQSIIDDIIEYNDENNLFTWTTDYDNDKVLSKEHILSMNCVQMYDNFNKFFPYSYKITDANPTFISDTRARALYEADADGVGDNRYDKLLFKFTNENSDVYAIPSKYELKESSLNIKMVVPLIRISEIYLMAAECAVKVDNDLTKAGELANTVRYNRGLTTPLDNSDSQLFMEDLEKEYAREFLAEGHLYYFYKRTGKAILYSPSNKEIEMGAEQYMLPYPKFEIQNGRVQQY